MAAERRQSMYSSSEEEMLFLTFHRLPGHDANVGVWAELATLTAPMEAHHHDFWELAFAVKGSGQHEDNQARLPLLSGDVWIIRPQQWHAYPLVRESLSIFNLLFTNDFVVRYMQLLQSVACLAPLLEYPSEDVEVPVRYMRLSAQGLEHIHTLLVTLAETLHAVERPGHISYCTGLVLQILGLMDRYNTGEPRLSQSLLASRHDVGVLAAVQYIEEEYGEALTLEGIAQQSGYTPTYLARKFRLLLGASPIDYLLQVRIHHACTLLKATSSPIAVVAHQVGFTDSRYFATRFRQAVGMTPSQFREQA